MMTREELEAAMERFYPTPSLLTSPLSLIADAARKQLALMPEKCGTCGGEGSPIVGYPCKDCHGSGKVYPPETVALIIRLLSFNTPDVAAIKILDALGEA